MRLLVLEREHVGQIVLHGVRGHLTVVAGSNLVLVHNGTIETLSFHSRYVRLQASVAIADVRPSLASDLRSPLSRARLGDLLQSSKLGHGGVALRSLRQ